MSHLNDLSDAKKVLIIGASQKVLKELSKTLKIRGFEVEWSSDYNNLSIIKEQFLGKAFDVIAFGRAVTEDNKNRLIELFTAKNPDVKFVNGMAPINNLLADQIEASLYQEDGLKCSLTNKKQISISGITSGIDMKVKFYRLNWMYRRTEKLIFDGKSDQTQLALELPKRFGKRFISISCEDKVLLVQEL